MLLAIDVGNTQTVFGIFEGEQLCHHFRLSSGRSRTHDEVGVLLREVLHDRGIAIEAIDEVVLLHCVRKCSCCTAHWSRHLGTDAPSWSSQRCCSEQDTCRHS